MSLSRSTPLSGVHGSMRRLQRWWRADKRRGRIYQADTGYKAQKAFLPFTYIFCMPGKTAPVKAAGHGVAYACIRRAFNIAGKYHIPKAQYCGGSSACFAQDLPARLRRTPRPKHARSGCGDAPLLPRCGGGKAAQHQYAASGDRTAQRVNNMRHTHPPPKDKRSSQRTESSNHTPAGRAYHCALYRGRAVTSRKPRACREEIYAFSNGTPFSQSAEAYSRLFCTGTQESSAVCHKKGRVLRPTSFSAESAAFCWGEEQRESKESACPYCPLVITG